MPHVQKPDSAKPYVQKFMYRAYAVSFFSILPIKGQVDLLNIAIL